MILRIVECSDVIGKYLVNVECIYRQFCYVGGHLVKWGFRLNYGFVRTKRQKNMYVLWAQKRSRYGMSCAPYDPIGHGYYGCCLTCLMRLLLHSFGIDKHIAMGMVRSAMGRKVMA